MISIKTECIYAFHLKTYKSESRAIEVKLKIGASL